MKLTNVHTALFGPYAVDLRSGELRKFGIRVRMGDQPFQILLLLLENPGEMVAREDLRAKLWTDDTFVDFDHGLNSAVQRLRDCLSDTAEKPVWVETIPRRGYRFVGQVEWSNGVPPVAPVNGEGAKIAQTSSSAVVVEAAKEHKLGRVASVAIAFLVAAAASLGVYFLVPAKRAAPFAGFTITKVTHNGKTVAAAISPDGKYLLSVLDDQGKESLWLRHVPTNSDAEVIAPADAFYMQLAFSPDGNYFYYLKATEKTLHNFSLLRAPVLGGASLLIARHVDTAITFSPDGKRIAFIRANDPQVGKFQLLIANSDGTNEKVFSGGPSTAIPRSVDWSPDGKQIASIVSPSGDALSAIQFQDVDSGKMLANHTFNKLWLDDLSWLADGRGLLVTYRPFLPILATVQIGFLSGSADQFRAVTNDTNSYQTLRLSADGKTLATVEQKSTQTMYLLPSAGFAGTSPKPALAQHKESFLFGWAANGDLYFDDGGELLQMSPDGTRRTTILSDPASGVVRACGCHDGRHILIEWAGRGGTRKSNIWRFNTDGSNPNQLTYGGADIAPLCSRDGKWAYYADWITYQIMRVPMDGGMPEIVPGTIIPNIIYGGKGLAISPDDKLLALLAGVHEHDNQVEKVALIPLDGGPKPPVQFLDLDPRVSSSPQFTPDGKALVYPILENSAENLWLQPIDGSRGRQITNFQFDTIQYFLFSPDGKSLGVFRAHGESDAVLLRDSGARSQ
jgi:eukaryotic-like serine/threonine-protein kinase